MLNIDFLSESPNLFIFLKENNKTNFGGILFLIYFIIMVIISIYYIANYIIDEKYIYGSETVFNNFDFNDYSKITEDDELNPFLNFTIEIIESELGPENFAVKDDFNYDYYEKLSEYKFMSRPNQLHLTVYYLCGYEDKNCTSFEPISGQFGYIKIEYPRYEINHLDYIPVKLSDRNGRNFELSMGPGDYQYNFEWEVIKYKDQKSIFEMNKKNDYIFGRIKDPYLEYNQNYKKEYGENRIELLNIKCPNYYREYISFHR